MNGPPSEVQEFPVVCDWLKGCHVTHIVSPSHFYVNLDENQRVIKIIKETLRRCYHASTPVLSSLPLPGVHLMVRNHGDEGDSFDRAIVISYISADTVQVKFVDVGEEKVVLLSQVRLLPPEASLMKFPCQAIKCSLRNCSEGAGTDEFKACVSDRRVDVHFMSKEEGTWKVAILKTSDLCVNGNATSHQKEMECMDVPDNGCGRLTPLSYELGLEETRDTSTRPLYLQRKEPPKKINPRTLQNDCDEPSCKDEELESTTPAMLTMKPTSATPTTAAALTPTSAIPTTAAALTPTLVSTLAFTPTEVEVRMTSSCASRAQAFTGTMKERLSSYEEDQEGINEFDEMLPPQPPLKSGVKVFVTHVDHSSRTIWVQREADTNLLTLLNSTIDEEVQKAKLLSTVDVGTLCLSHSLEDGLWYRAQVIRVEDEGVTVHYFDYGYTEQLPLLKMVEFPPLLRDIFKLGYACSFEGDTDRLSSNYTPEDEEMMVVRVVDTNNKNGVYIIERIDHPPSEKEEDERKDTTEIAKIESEIAKIESVDQIEQERSENQANRIEEKNKNAEEEYNIDGPECVETVGNEIQQENDQNTSEHDEEIFNTHVNVDSPKKSNEGVNGLTRSTSNETDGLQSMEPDTHRKLHNDCQQIGELKPALNIDLELTVSFVDDDGSLWLQINSNISDLNDVMNTLADLGDGLENVKQVREDLACAVKYSQDGEWYRAKVITVLEEKSEVRIRYIDYGNDETVKFEDLKVLPESCVDLLSQAFRCVIYNSQLDCFLIGKDIAPKVEVLTEQMIRGCLKEDTVHGLLLMSVTVDGTGFLDSEIFQLVTKKHDIYGAEVNANIVTTEDREELNVNGTMHHDSEIASVERDDSGEFEEDTIDINTKVISTKDGLDCTVVIIDMVSEHVPTEDKQECIATKIDLDSEITPLGERPQFITVDATNSLSSPEIVLNTKKERLQSITVDGTDLNASEIVPNTKKERPQSIIVDGTDLSASEIVLNTKTESFENDEFHNGNMDKISEDGEEVATEDENCKEDEIDSVKPSLSIPLPDHNNTYDLDLMVTFVEEDQTFWVQNLAESKELDELMNNIENYMKENNTTPIDPVAKLENTYAIAKFPDDDGWYRAKILSIVDSNSASVLYVDYGNVCEVPLTDIHKVPEEFCHLPSQAMHCSLNQLEKIPHDVMVEFIEYLSTLPQFKGTLSQRENNYILSGICINFDNTADNLYTEAMKTLDLEHMKGRVEENIEPDENAQFTIREHCHPPNESNTDEVVNIDSNFHSNVGPEENSFAVGGKVSDDKIAQHVVNATEVLSSYLQHDSSRSDKDVNDEVPIGFSRTSDDCEVVEVVRENSGSSHYFSPEADNDCSSRIKNPDSNIEAISLGSNSISELPNSIIQGTSSLNRGSYNVNEIKLDGELAKDFHKNADTLLPTEQMTNSPIIEESNQLNSTNNGETVVKNERGYTTLESTTVGYEEYANNQDILKSTNVGYDENANNQDILKSSTLSYDENTKNHDVLKSTSVGYDENANNQDVLKSSTLSYDENTKNHDVLKSTIVGYEENTDNQDVLLVDMPKHDTHYTIDLTEIGFKSDNTTFSRECSVSTVKESPLSSGTEHEVIDTPKKEKTFLGKQELQLLDLSIDDKKEATLSGKQMPEVIKVTKECKVSVKLEFELITLNIDEATTVAGKQNSELSDSMEKSRNLHIKITDIENLKDERIDIMEKIAGSGNQDPQIINVTTKENIDNGNKFENFDSMQDITDLENQEPKLINVCTQKTNDIGIDPQRNNGENPPLYRNQEQPELIHQRKEEVPVTERGELMGHVEDVSVSAMQSLELINDTEEAAAIPEKQEPKIGLPNFDKEISDIPKQKKPVLIDNMEEPRILGACENQLINLSLREAGTSEEQNPDLMDSMEEPRVPVKRDCELIGLSIDASIATPKKADTESTNNQDDHVEGTTIALKLEPELTNLTGEEIVTKNSTPEFNDRIGQTIFLIPKKLDPQLIHTRIEETTASELQKAETIDIIEETGKQECDIIKDVNGNEVPEIIDTTEEATVCGEQKYKPINPSITETISGSQVIEIIDSFEESTISRPLNTELMNFNITETIGNQLPEQLHELNENMEEAIATEKQNHELIENIEEITSSGKQELELIYPRTDEATTSGEPVPELTEGIEEITTVTEKLMPELIENMENISSTKQNPKLIDNIEETTISGKQDYELVPLSIMGTADSANQISELSNLLEEVKMLKKPDPRRIYIRTEETKRIEETIITEKQEPSLIDLSIDYVTNTPEHVCEQTDSIRESAIPVHELTADMSIEEAARLPLEYEDIFQSNDAHMLLDIENEIPVANYENKIPNITFKGEDLSHTLGDMGTVESTLKYLLLKENTNEIRRLHEDDVMSFPRHKAANEMCVSTIKDDDLSSYDAMSRLHKDMAYLRQETANEIFVSTIKDDDLSSYDAMSRVHKDMAYLRQETANEMCVSTIKDDDLSSYDAMSRVHKDMAYLRQETANEMCVSTITDDDLSSYDAMSRVHKDMAYLRQETANEMYVSTIKDDNLSSYDAMSRLHKDDVMSSLRQESANETCVSVINDDYDLSPYDAMSRLHKDDVMSSLRQESANETCVSAIIDDDDLSPYSTNLVGNNYDLNARFTMKLKRTYTEMSNNVSLYEFYENRFGDKKLKESRDELPSESESSEQDSLDDLVSHGTITYIEEEPLMIWVQDDEDSSQLDNVERILLQYSKDQLKKASDPKNGLTYCSYFFGKLLRVKILTLWDTTVRIHSIDIGNKINITVENLFECPSEIRDIPPLAKPMVLPVIINPNKAKEAYYLVRSHCNKAKCAFMDASLNLRSMRNCPFPYAEIATSDIGSISEFLIENDLASNFTHTKIVHNKLLEELRKAVITALEKQH